LRVKSNFPSRIKLFPSVQPLPKKYSGFPKSQITLYPPPSTPLEGRIAIVTDAGLDAMDVSGATDESAHLRTEKSCGPDASTLASSSRKQVFAGDGDKKSPIAGESTKETVKTIACGDAG